MNWLLRKLAHLLIGPGLSDRDELLDGLELAIQEEAERMGVKPCQHFWVNASRNRTTYTGSVVCCQHCGKVSHDTLPSPA